MIRPVLSLLITMCSLMSFAQIYGNEWINYSQTYYKFSIGEDGIYRISQQNLIDAGLPVASINPRNIQLFKNGVEQQIYVEGESDGSFDANDFIEFAATKNDGSLDAILYRKANEHTNPYVSLYSDTSTYFLTWSSTASTKHMSNYYDGNYTGKTGDDYFVYESITAFSDDFFEGIPNNNTPEQSFSEYSEGEGYVSSRSTQLKEFRINTPAPHIAGPNAQLEVKAYGINNRPEFVNGFNHGFGVAVSTKANVLKTKEHNGYSMVQFGYSDISFATSLLSDVTSVFMGEIDNVGRPESNYSIPYVKIRYPRSYDLKGSSELLFNSQTNTTYFRFANFNGGKASPIIYDVTNGQRIIGDVSGGTLQYNSSFASPKQMHVFDVTDTKQVSDIKSVTFDAISKENANYLIITHRKLLASATEYADYRSSTPGGSHRVKTLYAEDLYDQFYYGAQHHPMAIKNVISFVLDQLKEPVDHVLLLGKGQVYKNVRFDHAKREIFDLVPAIGNPPTDYLYVSPLDASSMTLQVPIGRVAAQNDSFVRIYLDKVKVHESAQPEEWHKKIIQVVGGKDKKENEQFNDYVTSYFNIANDSFLGATRVVFSKNEAVPVSTNLIEIIQKEVNKGANIFNYFGHGSSQIMEVDIGRAVDLNNYGKYPFFVFNGCALGNSFVDKSIGEEYMFERDKGSITWLASTGYGFPYELISYTRILHEELLQKQYGGTLGAAVKTTLERYQNPNEYLNVINCRQLLYQGDPAIKLHYPDKPDLYATNGRINNNFSAVDDILLDIDLFNIGKTTVDSVEVVVTAQNSDSTKEVYRGLLESPHYTSTEELIIDKTDFFRGLVKFTVTLDPQNKIDEMSPNGETNNTYSFDVLFELKKPLLIYPAMNGIVTASSVDYTFQIVNPNREDITIEIQLDTSPNFSSALLKTERFTTTNSLVTHSTVLPPLDNHDFFYRVKTIKDGEESDWSQRSFAYLFNTNEGWSERHNQNIAGVDLQFLRWNDDTSAMDFTRRVSDNYTFTTSGSDKSSWRRMVISGQFAVTINIRLLQGSPGYESVDGIHVVAFDPDTEKRFSEPNSSYNQPFTDGWWAPSPRPDQAEYYTNGNKTGLYNFHTANKEDRDSFLRYLQRLPDGYHVMFRNDLNTGIENWEPDLWAELAKFGIVKLQTVKEGEPFGVFGTKGDPTQSHEFLADYNDQVFPPTEQSIDKSYNIYPRVTSGTITSEPVGPASDWSSVEFDFKPSDSGTDKFNYSIVATDIDGRDTTYYSNETGNSLDITDIDANRFPYVKLVLNLEDTAGFTPYAINRWTVFYEGVTEGLIATDDLDESTGDTVEQGQPFIFATHFKNISNVNYDSTSAQVSIIDQSGIPTILDSIPLKELAKGEFIELADTLNTEDLAGKYQLYVNANFDKQILEQEYNNNLYYKEFYVNRDVRNPLLDVTFDGIHILNNDIVSANTTIVITGKDENNFLFLNDASLFTVELKRPGVDTFETLDESDLNFEFTPSTSASEPANIVYRAMDLKDGIYTLKVSLKDRTDNGESTPPYAIDFKVVNKKSISNVYPYPNPFTGCARFAFTVTGNEAPDQILISIYTITGRLVKQIDETELGAIRIGNNLSEYCWDGTDDFGDKLANGVYLYKAEVRSNGETIDLFETSGDHLFNNGFGKLYIAR